MDRRIDVRDFTLLSDHEKKIDQEIARIEEHHPGVIHHFRITIIGTKHHRQGIYEIHLIASVPGDTIVVKHQGERVRPLIVECFDTLDRQIREYRRRRQGMVKFHSSYPAGIMIEILPDEGYGFIESKDGRKIYVHRNAFKDDSFDYLKKGDSVIFGEERGEKGPQAAWAKRA